MTVLPKYVMSFKDEAGLERHHVVAPVRVFGNECVFEHKFGYLCISADDILDWCPVMELQDDPFAHGWWHSFRSEALHDQPVQRVA